MIDTGKLGEVTAVKYLRKNKWDIVSTNFRCRFGEIDIIAQNGEYLIFVEVKTRNENTIASPMEFVDEYKQKKIIRTAQMFLTQNQDIDRQPRFDVIEIHTKSKKVIDINHIENAFW